MFKISDRGEVVFDKKSKPSSVISAQREVRTVFMAMCKSQIEKSVPFARAAYLQSLGKVKDSLIESTPGYMSIVTSAARAYCAKDGWKLADRTLYSMDVVFTKEDVERMSDLPAELVTALRASLLPEFRFMARVL